MRRSVVVISHSIMLSSRHFRRESREGLRYLRIRVQVLKCELSPAQTAVVLVGHDHTITVSFLVSSVCLRAAQSSSNRETENGKPSSCHRLYMDIILNALQPAPQARFGFNWCQYSAIHQSKQRSRLAQTLHPPTRPLDIIGTSWGACLYPRMTRVSPPTRCEQLRTELSEFRHVFLVAGLAAYFFSPPK